MRANPTVAIIEPGSYTLQIEARNGEYTTTDTMQIVLYADACEHALNQEGFEWLPGDINHDCVVDDLDLAILQEHWLQWNYIGAPRRRWPKEKMLNQTVQTTANVA